MPEPSEIQLPAQLIPGDGRFGSGPALVRREALEALGATGVSLLGTSHRREGVRSVVRDIRTGLTSLYQLPDSYEVLLGVGGATAFWDAAAFGLIEQHSQHAVFGEFSGKFAAVTAGAPWLNEPEIVESAPGTHPPLLMADPDVDTYCLTHNETSTGVVMPVTRPRGGAAVVLVDATSAAGAIPVDPLQFDAYYFSPQKALGSEGGLWLALCSPQAQTRITALAKERWIPPFLSLSNSLENSTKDQTYNTPALATLFLLRDQIEWILRNGGLGWSAGRSSHSSQLVYDWADRSEYASPFVEIPAQRSPTTVTIDFEPSIRLDSLIDVLARHGIFDVGGYRKLGRNQLRVATYPNIEPSDIEMLLGAIDFVIERL